MKKAVGEETFVLLEEANRKFASVIDNIRRKNMDDENMKRPPEGRGIAEIMGRTIAEAAAERRDCRDYGPALATECPGDPPVSAVGPEQNGLRISWEIIGGHIILQAGCKRGIFHSYDEALFGLSKWAYELVREGIEKELKRQLESKP